MERLYIVEPRLTTLSKTTLRRTRILSKLRIV
jgi:hypothetical protein